MTKTTELEKIQYTKSFIDKLANGINPLDDSEIPEGDLLNNVRMTRCMFYVSDILRQVIENGGTQKAKRIAKIPFSITPEQLSKYEYSGEISASEMSKKMFSLAENENMSKLTYNDIASWLIKCGMLAERQTLDGKTKKYPTEEGIKIGMFTERRNGLRGEYDVILYNKEAQQFVLDNIDAVICMKYNEN